VQHLWSTGRRWDVYECSAVQAQLLCGLFMNDLQYSRRRSAVFELCDMARFVWNSTRKEQSRLARSPESRFCHSDGEAGFRCGEIMALEWTDVDLSKRQVCVQRSDWKGHVTTTKGGRVRYVPLTSRLTTALREHRHLRGSRVLCQRDGSPLTQKIVQDHVRRSGRRASLAKNGVHRLRHTFCPHLAMKGAPARAIQELAGHQDLATTQRYMHLSPAAVDGAIRLLETPFPILSRGNIVATGTTEIANSSR